MISNEDKCSGVIKKKKYRCRKNPKQRKYKKKKQKKLLPMPSRMDNSWMHRQKPIDYGQSFWNNYKRAMEWRNSCLEGYWKNQARKFQEENIALKQRLSQVTQKYASDRGADTSGILHNSSSVTKHEEESLSDSQSDYEVTEEFMKFIEISLQHKASLKKNKQKIKKGKKVVKKELQCREGPATETSLGDGLCEAPDEDSNTRRNEEMKLLFGNECSKIQGMETAMHLSFMRKCDRNKPIMWPVVPLSHSFSSNSESSANL